MIKKTEEPVVEEVTPVVETPPVVSEKPVEEPVVEPVLSEQEKAVDAMFDAQFTEGEDPDSEGEGGKKEEEAPEIKKEEVTPEVPEVKKEEAKPSEPTQGNEEEKKILESMNLQKFKTVKDALEAYKELESSFGKAQTTIQAYQKGIIPEDMKEGVQGAINMVSRPRVKFDSPDPEGYQNKDGTFDVKSYMDETLAGYTVSLQKSLVFGELASALYTVLSQSITDKHTKLQSQATHDRQAEEIAKDVNDMFPALKTDTDVAEIFSGLVLARHNQKKQALTRDDFIELAKRATSFKKSPTPQKELKQAEIGGFVGQMSANEKPFEAPQNEQEKAVDELFEKALTRNNDPLF